MEDAILVIWAVVGGTMALSLLLPLRDSFRRKKRGALIKQISESLNWEFFPRYRLPRFDLPVNVFVVRSNDLDMLTAVFTPEVIAHYEKVPNLYIDVQNNRILLHFHEGKYLEPVKENYLDLIAEGKYINELIKPFLP